METIKHLRVRSAHETLDTLSIWAGSAALLAVSYYGVLWLAGQIVGVK